ncbi:predicted protein [Sclerotinia sclerotiorum 1980 UF-70]|uniref:Uncharacterized protein n=1 Tax=Sclerotinia sclerotiorum (strain ATCC 18683 / 1980 / Ss-1) TaxID=665079 RepID=A7F4V7_SCLS1|nr:predicted protein [Sclerotinia sclerotiorum 1980 UF-70]EDN97778.1 predicted protein [Sclerotinia sclerotiorum 1980 UF-70]
MPSSDSEVELTIFEVRPGVYAITSNYPFPPNPPPNPSPPPPTS